jgi:hypothetical protein
VVVILLGGWLIYAPLITRISFLDPEPPERQLLSFLETLPKDALLAGTPCALDDVSLFAKRQILFSCEHIRPDEPLMREALKMYYTDNPQEIANFCRKHSVNYLVIDQHTYSDEFLEQGEIFFEPFNQEVLSDIAGQKSFTLAQVPNDLKIFQSGDYFVVPCDQIGSQ